MRCTMERLAQLAEAISATTRKTEKVRLLSAYLRSEPPETAAFAAVFLSGRTFPAWEETTTNVGGTLMWRAVAELARGGEAAVQAAYGKFADIGSAAEAALRATAPKQSTLSVAEVEQAFRALAQARGNAKRPLLVALLRRATALEAKYILRILARELRIGLKESLVEEAIAQAFLPAITTKDALRQVQRANMLLGDIGETLRLAATGRLEQARMRLFHPIGFMLASPAQTAEEAHQYFEHATVEDKYDGIRAQAHISGRSSEPQVRLFSRTFDDVTGSFPELPPALATFADDLILDGEVVAWSGAGKIGRALPFAQLQKRLGRKAVSAELMRAVPVSYIAFDVLYAEGELVIDRPLSERAAMLDRIFAGARRAVMVGVKRAQGELMFEPAVDVEAIPGVEVTRAPVSRADSVAELEQQFEAALARGNEGLMVKDLESPYAPGRRGKSWLKLKRELATLDVVVTAVEWGHGKRAGVLSDYTFAVREGDRLLNVGKAYSGLTDHEIAEMTRWFQEHTLADEGWRRTVEPSIVLEVAFNAVMRSDRHESGYALRFPRILRIRNDKPVEEIDPLERVREIYDSQKWPEGHQPVTLKTDTTQ